MNEKLNIISHGWILGNCDYVRVNLITNYLFFMQFFPLPSLGNLLAIVEMKRQRNKKLSAKLFALQCNHFCVHDISLIVICTNTSSRYLSSSYQLSTFVFFSSLSLFSILHFNAMFTFFFSSRKQYKQLPSCSQVKYIEL